MIIPVRCFSCGKPIGHLYEEFQKRTAKGEDKGVVLNELGLKRYCCRGIFLTQTNTIDTVAQFKKG